MKLNPISVTDWYAKENGLSDGLYGGPIRNIYIAMWRPLGDPIMEATGAVTWDDLIRAVQMRMNHD